MSYSILAAERGRHFEITGGLVEGYDNLNQYHSLDEVYEAHASWQKARNIIQGVRVMYVKILYGWRENAELEWAEEPGFLISGGINILYDTDLSDDDALARILDLAEWMGAALGQTRMYVTFDERDYILERTESGYGNTSIPGGAPTETP